MPKFQAIQTAHEILGDELQKNKYDADRRRAGLYPNLNASGGATGGPAPRGNPYQAASAYPPPPRRTQPGTWQRPPQPASAQSTGADRFSGFPRGGAAPTAKRADPAAERQNAFRAWQNMNNAQDRQSQQSRYTAQPAPETPPRRPAPPPRPDTRFPSDEKIRAGFKHRDAPPQNFTADKAEERQSAWAAFQQAHSGKPGVSRSNTTKTPKKQGFDPNMPGSDERPAPDSAYVHRHKSEDFGRPSPVPPPPPGPPPPSQPASPISPGTHPQRPMAEPLRPFKTREDDAPYSEGNRKRTPYSSFIGERTDFSGGMRRSNSTRDTTRLNADTNGSRARSTSPLGRQTASAGNAAPQRNAPNQQKPTFSMGGSSGTSPESSDADMGTTPEPYESPFAHPPKTSVPPQHRPKKVPSPPSKRFNGSANPTSPPPVDGTAAADAGMKQKSASNMYVVSDPFTDFVQPQQHLLFSRSQRTPPVFGTPSTIGVKFAKSPASPLDIPASWFPKSKMSVPQQPDRLRAEASAALETLALDDPLVADATPEEQIAYIHFRVLLVSREGRIPRSLDMEAFKKLASTARFGKHCGHNFAQDAIQQILNAFPSVGHTHTLEPQANGNPPAGRFSFPTSPDLFSPTAGAKSRSEENINTKFSAEGWSGTFSGSGDYFAPPTSSASRRNSPSSKNQRPAMRSATSNYPQSPTFTNGANAGSMPPPPRPVPHTADGPDSQSAGGEVKFSKEQWEQTFKDGSWTWPPPPPKPASGVSKAGTKSRGPSRKGSKNSARAGTPNVGTAANPQVVDEADDETVDLEKVKSQSSTRSNHFAEPEPMDIDNTPPAIQQAQVKQPRQVSVPMSAWHAEQKLANGTAHRRNVSSSGSANLPVKTNLSDLAKVAPFSAPSSSGGLKDLNPLASSLPFQSQAAATLPTHPLKPQTLQTPVVPVPPKPPTRLTKEQWHQYAQNFALFLRAFHAFNTAMLAHFQAREQAAQQRMQTGMQWLEATGDPSLGGMSGGGVGGMLTGPSGYGSYLQAVKEDERVREVWGLGCERHAHAAREFEDVRERVRKLVVGGGLVDR